MSVVTTDVRLHPTLNVPQQNICNAEDQSGKMGSSNAIRQVSTNAQLPYASNRGLWHKAEAHPNQLVPMVVQLYVDIVLQSSSAGLAIMWYGSCRHIFLLQRYECKVCVLMCEMHACTGLCL